MINTWNYLLLLGGNSAEYRVIEGSLESQYKVMANGSLLIRSSTAEDSGYFLCQIDNGVGLGISQTVILNVNSKISIHT